MRIIIAGDGKEGTALTKLLSNEGHDVVVIDTKASVLVKNSEKFDIMTVVGNCMALKTLQNAGVEKSDLLIAVTGSDEVNLLTCITARKFNPRIHTIPRVRNPEYFEQLRAMRDDFGLSLIVNPDKAAATEIFRLLQFPVFLKRETFANGNAEIIQLRVSPGGVLDGAPLNKQIEQIMGCKVLVCAVVRDGVAFIPGANTILCGDDDIFVTAPTAVLSTMLKNLGVVAKKIHSVLIIGGGRTSLHLAGLLIDSGTNVKIIEQDEARCLELAELLPKASIINGDGSSQEILDREGVDMMDAIVTLTGLDEVNIVVSMYADSVKVKKIITKINHMSSPVLLANTALGSVINQSGLSGNIIAQYVRAMDNQTGAALTVHLIANEQVEAMEFLISKQSPYINTSLKDIPIKKNVLVSCIAHNGKTIIPGGMSQFTVGDTVVVVAAKDIQILQLDDIFD